MPMQKGKWHRVNGKLVRRYKPRRKVVHNAEFVDESSNVAVRYELKGVTPVRLEAILNGLWMDLSLADKVECISTKYFDPSNPGND